MPREGGKRAELYRFCGSGFVHCFSCLALHEAPGVRLRLGTRLQRLLIACRLSDSPDAAAHET